MARSIPLHDAPELGPEKVGAVRGDHVVYVVSREDLPMLRQLGGNMPNPGDLLAATVVQVWSADDGMVNLRVHLDGPKDYWATSVPYYEWPEGYDWADQVDGPPRVERTWHFRGQVMTAELVSSVTSLVSPEVCSGISDAVATLRGMLPVLGDDVASDQRVIGRVAEKLEALLPGNIDAKAG